ncbi:hypothetical protein Sdia_60450 [Streptomyces diastaticus subsp. diastaticus]|uniref:Uncharacterized protein n=1 Tax=Streptomyces diastaticus subsp. diastaticus TaxID=68040 RepID=A0ABQ1CY92_STRDI|nr:hypothetical protein Sdia_60450 [Streptomyces diastaticus subsp. diastaticus]
MGIAALLAVAGLVSGWVRRRRAARLGGGDAPAAGGDRGTGIPVPGPWWRGRWNCLGGALFRAGADLPALALAAPQPEREAVIAVFDAAERALSRAGTPARPRRGPV